MLILTEVEKETMYQTTEKKVILTISMYLEMKIKTKPEDGSTLDLLKDLLLST